jgi:hypothetical protein
MGEKDNKRIFSSEVLFTEMAEPPKSENSLIVVLVAWSHV